VILVIVIEILLDNGVIVGIGKILRLFSVPSVGFEWDPNYNMTIVTYINKLEDRITEVVFFFIFFPGFFPSLYFILFFTFCI